MRAATYSPGNPGISRGLSRLSVCGVEFIFLTSESTRTVREAQLAAEDFLQPPGGARPGETWARPGPPRRGSSAKSRAESSGAGGLLTPLVQKAAASVIG